MPGFDSVQAVFASSSSRPRARLASPSSTGYPGRARHLGAAAHQGRELDLRRGRAGRQRARGGYSGERVKIGLFMVVGFGCWFLGMHMLFAYNTVQSGAGIGNELLYIAAAVVGGCLLTGGYGSAVGSALGAFIFGMTTEGVIYADWDPDWFMFFVGAMLLLATVVNTWFRARARRGSRWPAPRADHRAQQRRQELRQLQRAAGRQPGRSSGRGDVHPRRQRRGQIDVDQHHRRAEQPRQGGVPGGRQSRAYPRRARRSISASRPSTRRWQWFRCYRYGATSSSARRWRCAEAVSAGSTRPGCRRSGGRAAPHGHPPRGPRAAGGHASGGQRQVVAIARAIHFGARVLILDEPTAALGVTQSGLVLRYIARAAREQGMASSSSPTIRTTPISSATTSWCWRAARSSSTPRARNSGSKS